MPVDPNATIEVTAFDWVPDFARGLVRDLRVRWALEEAGLSYRERLLNARTRRPREYFGEQPFGQVPVFVEGETKMFESGAIVLHIGERSEALLPRESVERSRALCWLFAALNSVEPPVMEFANVDIFDKDEDWAKLRRPSLLDAIETRLWRVSIALGDADFLAGRFTAADLVMTTVLRDLRDTDLVGKFGNLAAYVARCEARPAFKQALSAQLAAFDRQAGVAA